jgi:hypothetical protein
MMALIKNGSTPYIRAYYSMAREWADARCSIREGVLPAHEAWAVGRPTVSISL